LWQKWSIELSEHIGNDNWVMRLNFEPKWAKIPTACGQKSREEMVMSSSAWQQNMW